MKIAEPAMRNVLGIRRIFGLALLLAAVAAVAYLDRSVGGDFDLRLVYFLIVLPVARMLGYFEPAQATTERPCPECTRSIPIEARRCPECTSVLTGPGVGR